MAQKSEIRICPKCQLEDASGIAYCPRDNTEMELKEKDQLIGELIADKYEILALIGRGGMSVVYKAQHTMMDRLVAVKMLRPELVSVPQLLQRFKIESKAAAGLRHPNIVTLFDFGLMPNTVPYLIMDYLEGQTLAEVLKESGPMPTERITPLIAQACDALAHAHEKGIIHRDIKPSNLLVRKDTSGERLTIFDFGIAKILGQDGSTLHKLTTSGEVFGSPLYMSPEQCAGEKIGPGSDLYSLACCLFEGLTGRPPFQGQSPMDTLLKHMEEDPPMLSEVLQNDSIPPDLEACVMKALNKEPSERQKDMIEFRDELLRAIDVDLRTVVPHRTYDKLPVQTPPVGMTPDSFADSAPRMNTGLTASREQHPMRRREDQLRSGSSHTVAAPSARDDNHRLTTHNGNGSSSMSNALKAAIAAVVLIGALAGGFMIFQNSSEHIELIDTTHSTGSSGTAETGVTEGTGEDGPTLDDEALRASSDTENPIEISKVGTKDQIQLAQLDGGGILIDFEKPISHNIPSPLLADGELPSNQHARCRVYVSNLEPGTLSVADAAKVLPKQIFKDEAWRHKWRKATMSIPGNREDSELFLQEVVFFKRGSAEDKAQNKDSGSSAAQASAAGNGAAGTSGNEAAPGDTPVTSTQDESNASKEGDNPYSQLGDNMQKESDAGSGNSNGAAANDSKAGEASDSSDEQQTATGTDSSDPGVIKEYIAYIKRADRLVACQFVPSNTSGKELQEMVARLIPRLENVVKVK